MLERVRALVLRLLRVPAEPQPPAGDPASVRVFRAAPNYFRVRLALWALRQVLALLGIVFWLVAVGYGRAQWQAQQAAAAAAPATTNAPVLEPVTLATNAPAAGRRNRKRPAKSPAQYAGEVAKRLPGWALPVFVVLEVLAILFFFVQAVFTYVVLRLDYEQRWYVVTDRSLRIRSGVWSVWEMTMSFANLQQVVVTQGPLQRWLGLADLRVESAGGGGSAHSEMQGQKRSLHVGFFHGVGNAEEIRDLILARLRDFRQSGLGDPDERNPLAPTPTVTRPGGDSVAAARELLAAARELRGALARKA
jgi:hypothetical protein